VSVTGMSLERTIQRAGFWRVELSGAGAWVSSLVLALVQQVMPDVAWSVELNQTPLPDMSFKPGEDRLAKIVDIANSGAAAVRFDRQGGLLMRNWVPPLQRQANVSWTLTDALDGEVATLLSAEREFADEDSYNGVVIEGGAVDGQPPVFFTQWITNPQSPLYFDPDRASSRRRGPRPKHVRNEFVTTVEQAQAAAQSILAHWMAVTDQVTATAPANPTLTIDGFVRLKSRGLGVDAPYHIRRATHDLAGAPTELLLDRPMAVT
jgi:hypothetical protein